MPTSGRVLDPRPRRALDRAYRARDDRLVAGLASRDPRGRKRATDARALAAREQLVEFLQRGSRRLLRLRDAGSHPDATALSAVSLFFTLSMLRFLEGTVLKESADALWDKVL